MKTTHPYPLGHEQLLFRVSIHIYHWRNALTRELGSTSRPYFHRLTSAESKATDAPSVWPGILRVDSASISNAWFLGLLSAPSVSSLDDDDAGKLGLGLGPGPHTDDSL